MERFDIGSDGPLIAIVDAVERGETVELVRGGLVVAKVAGPERPHLPGRRTPLFDPTEWEALHRLTGPLRDETGADTIRRMRDLDD